MFNDLPYNQAGLLPALPTDMKPSNLPAFHYIKEKGDSTRFALPQIKSHTFIMDWKECSYRWRDFVVAEHGSLGFDFLLR